MPFLGLTNIQQERFEGALQNIFALFGSGIVFWFLEEWVHDLVPWWLLALLGLGLTELAFTNSWIYARIVSPPASCETRCGEWYAYSRS